ncbi:MAG: hypothetical protein D6748_14935, partial [Calditrichaeota bacterium]
MRKLTVHFGRVIILVLTLWLFPGGIIHAQPSSSRKLPLVINRLDFHSTEKVPVSLKPLQKRYLQRVFTKELQQELLQELIAQYHERGYYFVQVDSHS